MTALSADVSTLKTQPRAQTKTFVLKNSTSFYVGGLVGTDGNGYLAPWADSAGYRFQGVFLGFEPPLSSSTGAVITAGDTSASPKIRGIVDVSGRILKSVDVANVTSIANINDYAYCADDNYATLSTTASTNVGPVGYLVDFASTSDMDVQLFTPEEYVALNNMSVSIVTLTDSTGGSGTHDDTVADGLTTVAATAATSATVTGTLTGSVDGAMADVAAIALSTSNTYTDSAVNTAVNTAITAVNLQLKELQTALNEAIADIASLYTFAGTVLTDLTVQNQNDSDIAQKVIQILAALAK